MKIRAVTHNNHKHAFHVAMGRLVYSFPYAKSKPAPMAADPVARVFVDKELASEGFTYELRSGREGTIHAEQVLEYNRDPSYLRDLLVYQLTLEAQRRIAQSPLAKREIVRRLGTSAAQLYRLLDAQNDRKSVDQLVALLSVLDCDVDLVVHKRRA
ncbi:MAG: helix-turn-helix transcriptional regulator [Myxococcota bacterium]